MCQQPATAPIGNSGMKSQFASPQYWAISFYPHILISKGLPRETIRRLQELLVKVAPSHLV